MLTKSISILTEAQNQLIESERAITVNRLMNNLSQKINTPVGTNITLSTYLLEENHKIQVAYKQGELTRSRLEEHFQTIDEGLSEIQNNLHISATLVERFKEFNKRKLMDEIGDFSLGALIQEVIELLSPKLNELCIRVTTEVTPGLVLHNYPSVLRHIIFNLLMHPISNSVAQSSREVMIQASELGDQLLISYTDNMVHISDQVLSKAFDTFYVLNHGDQACYVELNTIYMLIQEIEKGHICIDPLYMDGNRLDITLPLRLIELDDELDLSELIHHKR